MRHRSGTLPAIVSLLIAVFAPPAMAQCDATYQLTNGFGGLQLTDGMIVVGSGATFSPNVKSSNVLLTDSNLTATATNASYAAVLASASQSSGKYYFEFQM
ncbi:hypothetical protein HFN69_35050 [Rhizobium laguerreae]|uniref:hypothetical protein n=1 Tax=Rhizobium laguerreae TaxID=1076926 RepID=UPI001C9138AB|nr:hypothetical protein [Rhizobium laguerreae]MBY3544966.1 hypothetical protein [Rhizobium laguerreae]MBY3551709.1 hypothetical protein [Rhizobium laguerreae]